MRFYTQQHPYYCGIDLHTRKMYVCILDQAAHVLVHRNIQTRGDHFLNLIASYREGLVVGVECMFSWYWLADLCEQEDIEFVLGHALYMRAIHGAKAKNEKIDSKKIAYYGMSWGAMLGAIIPAVEERLEASVLLGGGFFPRLGRPEANQINYVTRVKVPTLMLNGRYDTFYPPETASKPMFDLLGTPDGHKELRLYETDHIPPRNEFIKETLAWLDRYLGPVK